MPASLQVWCFDASEERDPEQARSPRTCTILAAPADVPVPEHLARALADAALQAWPAWWGATAETTLQDVLQRGREAMGRGGRGWVEPATRLAADGQRPLLDDMPRAVQVGFLASALGELVIDVESPALDEPSADALSRGLEWLAALLPEDEVRWLIPRDAATLPGVRRLPSVEPFEPREPREPVQSSEPVQPSEPVEPRMPIEAGGRSGAPDAVARPAAPGVGGVDPRAGSIARDAAESGGSPEPARPAWPVRFDPIVGRPHPASPAEQALFRALQESDLAGVFQPNHPVRTRPGPRLVVDLYGATPRLVVEIDGYAFHRGPSAFQRDRNRDFCLLASGLRVLRLTHDEIMRSVDEAVAKIRAVIDAYPPEAPDRED